MKRCLLVVVMVSLFFFFLNQRCSRTTLMPENFTKLELEHTFSQEYPKLPLEGDEVEVRTEEAGPPYYHYAVASAGKVWVYQKPPTHAYFVHVYQFSSQEVARKHYGYLSNRTDTDLTYKPFFLQHPLIEQQQTKCSITSRHGRRSCATVLRIGNVVLRLGGTMEEDGEVVFDEAQYHQFIENNYRSIMKAIVEQ